MDINDQSHYKGDYDSYFPLSYSSNIIIWGKLPVTLEYDGWTTGTDLFFSENELSIDDNILTYNSRSTTFINYLKSTTFRVP